MARPKRLGMGTWLAALAAANIAMAVVLAEGAEALQFQERFCSGSGNGGECLINGLLESCDYGPECRN